MQPLDRATNDDYLHAIECDGTPTDVYRLRASRIFAVSYERVTPQQREFVKRMAYARRYTYQQN
jgi:DNA polymerase I-like protein with 3'-5' exonuclease and polymerase domains